MTKVAGTSLRIMLAMALIWVGLRLHAADQPGQGAHVKSVSAITEVFGDGQKLTAAVVEYDAAIDNAKLTQAAFTVQDRTITRIYANAAARTSQGVNGRFVVLELDPADDHAAVFVQRGRTANRTEAKVTVVQNGPLTLASQERLEAPGHPMTNDRVVNLVVDDFRQLQYKDPATGQVLAYNLFVPKNYDKTKTYPLVLFMHDAGVVSTDPRTTLVQGLGAVIWASPSEQAKHECFVLAPQYATWVVNDKSEASGELDMTVALVNLIANQYSVDRGRLYTTGQSLGCMMSIAIDIKYPGLFAASFLVAGQWDPAKVAPLAKDKLWIVVSEGDLKAFPGMNAITAALDQEGAKIARATWNGRWQPAEFAAAVAQVTSTGCPILYTPLRKGTVVTPGLQDDGGSNHICTWRIAYTIEGIRDWLFRQRQ